MSELTNKEKRKNRDEIERSIVSYDKQKLITEVLKVYDVNVRLADELVTARNVGIETTEKLNAAKKRINELETMTIWQKINQRLEFKISKIKARRTRTFI